MRFLALSLAFLLLPLPAFSATSVPVQSGEHATYTRLVIRINEGTAWEISLADRQAKISIEQPSLSLDLSKIFLKIPKSRIQSVIQTLPGDPLTIDLNCNCAVEGFVQSGIWLVIDVKDGDDGIKARSPYRSKPSNLSFLQTEQLYRFSSSIHGTSKTPKKEQDNIDQRQKLDNTKRMEDATNLEIELPFHPSRNNTDEGDDLEVPHIELSRLSNFERNLIEQFDQAENQGLIQNQSIDTENFDSTETSPSGGPVQNMDQPALTLENVVVQTSIGRDLIRSSGHDQGSGISSCQSGSNLEVHKWTSGRSFDEQISALRLDMMGEFDSIDVNASRKLAKTYLYFGFGAEARQIVLLEDGTSEDIETIIDLSYLVDGDTALPSNSFYSKHACDNDAALWAILANPAEVSNANHSAVLQAFSRLPEHLRLHLGPRISRTYSIHGLASEAETILRNIDRILQEATPGIELALGSVAAAKGETETSELHRMSAIENESEYSTYALVDLIETALLEASTVSPEVVDLSASYATEFRHGDNGPKLRWAHTVALGLTGDFDSAFGFLDVVEEFDGVEPRSDLQKILLSLLTQRASDVDFLKFSLLSTETSMEAPLPDDLGNKLARRFLDLGFSRPAVRILASSEENPASKDRRLMRAEAALGQNLPHEAMVALLGIAGVEADALRAKALIQLDRHKQAADYLIASDAREEAARSLWIADAEQPSQTPEGSLYSEIAETTEALLSPSPAQEGNAMLERARRLAEGSQIVRQDISNLLEALPISE